jgi:hypothetical protein
MKWEPRITVAKNSRPNEFALHTHWLIAPLSEGVNSKTAPRPPR